MLPLILFKAEAELIYTHLIQLDDDSKRMRFGYMPTDSAIIKYVTESFNHKNSAWYGYLVEGVCIGAIHVIIEGESSELGISVDAKFRGQKLSNQLFDRALTHLKAQGIQTVTMQCLSENMAMQHIAKKHGMQVVTIGPGEKGASVTIDLGNPILAKIQDTNSDVLALIDASFRNQHWFIDTLNTAFRNLKPTTLLKGNI